MRRLAVGMAALALSLLGSTGIAAAAASPDPVPSLADCQPDPAHYGEFPTCTYDENGKIIDKSYDNGPFGDSGGGGMPGAFVGLLIVAIVIGVGVTVWRVSMARDMARRAGLDPNQATAVTLMSNDGLDATYLAANLRGSQATPAPGDTGHVAADVSGAAPQPAAHEGAARPTDERLRELEQLREQKLITDSEYDARRKAIVESI